MKNPFKKLLLIWVLGFCVTFPFKASGAEAYATLKNRAERAFAERSYQEAHEIYKSINLNELSPAERRWVELRLADTALRSSASSNQSDDSAYQAAKSKLEELTRQTSQKDLAWAEANEALADAQWVFPKGRSWPAAWPFYQAALEYWAASTNLATAREHYLGIVRRMATLPGERIYWYGYWGNSIPISILENALKIAQSEEDKTHFHYLIAMSLRQQSNEWEQRFRVPKEFEAAIKAGKKSDWYDDALYFYAEWMASNGLAVQQEDGSWRYQPDYEKALEIYRRITSEFRKEESRWYDPALNQIRQITAPTINVSVSNTFLPGSEIEYHLAWRNVDNVQLTLHKVNLTEDIDFLAHTNERGNWLDAVDLSRGRKIKSWTRQTKPKHPHEPGSEQLYLDEKLEKGAYVLEATAEGAKSREIILVTDIAIIAQVVNGHFLFYVANAATGAPLADAKVAFWNRYYQNSRYLATKYDGNTDTNGIVPFNIDGETRQNDYFVTAVSGSSQAFAQGSSYFSRDPKTETWKIYAVTDRPAYRPGETVHWKITARQMEEMGNYRVPEGQTVRLVINDPRGTEIYKSDLKLNSFGSAWGDLVLKTNLPLGEFRAVFKNSDDSKILGDATLFRLEEYKLPEFKVSIHSPEENGRKKTFLLGEKIEVEIEAEYYFGGPVANANIEAVVNQSPFYHIFDVDHEFPWFYTSQEFNPRHPRVTTPGQVVQRESLKTDENGKAKLTIQTPFGSNDLEYRIEVRVVDASRREITASDSIRVSTQRFYVDVRSEHNIYRPQDKVEVTFKARDINEQPVQAEGKVTVTRDVWFEIWLDPTGREVKGDELKRLQRAAIFPPRPQPGEKDWRLKFRGYSHDQILTKTLKTSTNGLATLSFTPEKTGYYRITWRTDETLAEGQIPSRPITGETTVWVATEKTTELGYRPGGIQIVVDKDTFKSGQDAPVMLSAPGNDRYVLFTVTAENIIHYQLVHMEGSAKLIQLSIGENFIPNVFLHAASIYDQELLMDKKEVVVPPVKQFLNLDIIADQEQFQPGETGHFTLKVLDHDGKPISAEVALSTFDESLLYIQEDLTQDPRQFFYGQKRNRMLLTSSSFNEKGYQKVTRRELEAEAKDLLQEGIAGQVRYAPEAKQELARYSRLGMADSAAMATRGMSSELPVLAKSVSNTQVAQAAILGVANAPAEQSSMEQAVEVRSDFRTSIFWQPDIKTDADGMAKIEIKYPDSLTAWQSVAQAVTTKNQFGIGRAKTRTQQPLIARLQAPRFFVVGDTVTISAVINNNTEESMAVAPSLEASGVDQPENSNHESINIPAHSEKRVDWSVQPRAPGEARLKLIARGGKFSDAMEKSYPIFEHGIEKFVSISGKSTEGDIHAALDLPAERKPDSTRMFVQVTPSIAVTMLDALPYLINYPYGCTEQTMSRFLPTVLTARTLKQLQLDPEQMLNRVFGGIEVTNAAATHPGGKQDLEKLNEMVKSSLERLYNFQHADGGWGWWKEGESDRFMTAYVLWGLSLATQSAVPTDNQVVRRAAKYLDQNIVKAEADYPMQAWMLHALAVHARVTGQPRPSDPEEKAFANLWQNRDRLNSYSRALLALAAQNFGKRDEAKTLVRNLSNGVKIDKNPGATVLNANNGKTAPSTAHWGEDGFYWRWSEGGVEATAFALRALLEIDPDNELVDPVINWLVKNRRGAQWSNTRDTAIVVLALNDYLKISRELTHDLEYEILVNGKSIATKKITRSELLQAPSRFEVTDFKDGKNAITIRRITGEGPIYYAADATFFSTEEPITPAGNEIFVKRDYYKLVPIPTLLNGYTYKKERMAAHDKVQSGDRIETVITVEAKNNYEYLLFEDLKPAGFEAVQVQSGENLVARQLRSSAFQKKPAKPVIGESNNPDERTTGNERSIYQEIRDRKVALFIDKLPQGIWEIRYEMRAEIPGEFHALPVMGHAMYVPEIRANGAESYIEIRD